MRTTSIIRTDRGSYIDAFLEAHVNWTRAERRLRGSSRVERVRRARRRKYLQRLARAAARADPAGTQSPGNSRAFRPLGRAGTTIAPLPVEMIRVAPGARNRQKLRSRKHEIANSLPRVLYSHGRVARSVRRDADPGKASCRASTSTSTAATYPLTTSSRRAKASFPEVDVDVKAGQGPGLRRRENGGR